MNKRELNQWGVRKEPFFSSYKRAEREAVSVSYNKACAAGHEKLWSCPR